MRGGEAPTAPTRQPDDPEEDPSQHTTPGSGTSRADHLNRITSRFKTTISARKAARLARLLDSD